MKTIIMLSLLPLAVAGLYGQGPGPGFGKRGGPFGPGGFGGFGGLGPDLLGAGPGPGSPVTGAPYSATETVTYQQALANGNQISRTVTATVARDSQGRVSTSETVTPPASSGKAAVTIETIFDPVAGYRYKLDSSTMTAFQSPLPKAPASPPAARAPRTPPSGPDAPQIATTSLGTQVINGVASTGTQVTETIPAGAIGNSQPIQIVRVTWVSNELKIPVQIRTSDPRFGTRDMELTNIIQAEPNASLFLVPAGYTVKQGGPGFGGGGGARAARGRKPAPAQ
jgi:hypothetical protein